MAKKVYCIEFYGDSGNGYIGYDNEACNCLDSAMTFETEEEATIACEKLQKEWKSALRVSCYSED